MDTEEVKTILEIMAEADNKCNSCVSHLYELFLNKYPEHKNIAEKVIAEYEDHPLRD